MKGFFFFWKVLTGSQEEGVGRGPNLNDKLLPTDWLEDLLQVKMSSPLIGLSKGTA